jgi:hypothetical protein
VAIWRTGGIAQPFEGLVDLCCYLKDWLNSIQVVTAVMEGLKSLVMPAVRIAWPGIAAQHKSSEMRAQIASATRNSLLIPGHEMAAFASIPFI